MTATKAMQRPTRMECPMFQPLWTNIYIYEPYMDFSINKNIKVFRARPVPCPILFFVLKFLPESIYGPYLLGTSGG